MLFNKRKILDFALLFLLVSAAGLGAGAKEVKAEKIWINEDRTWEGEEIIVVSDRLIFETGTKLVVKPGTKVEFRKGGFLEIGGELIIEGIEAEPVVFYRERWKLDQDYCLYNITIGPTGKAQIDNWIFRGAGGHIPGGGDLSGLSIRGEVEINNSLITENTRAIKVREGGKLKMRDCELYDDPAHILEVDNAAQEVDVRENYWGDDSGPRNQQLNPQGRGARIEGANVQLDPWQQKGHRPVILVPGFAESINLNKLLLEVERGEWELFDPEKNTGYLKGMLLDQGYEENKDLWIAYYDWRRPSGEIMCQYLRPVIERARQETGFKEVELIGFSFGGLIARRYLQSQSYDYDVNNLLALGTPHLGTSQVYSFAEGGRIPSGWWPLMSVLLWLDKSTKNFFTMDYIRENFPSVFEMMPVYDFLWEEGVGKPNPVTEMVYFNQMLADMNAQLETQEERAELHFWGGTGFPTVKDIPVEPPSLLDDLRAGYWADGKPVPIRVNPSTDQGDGTVPMESAAWEVPGRDQVATAIYEALHQELPRVDLPRVGRVLGIGGVADYEEAEVSISALWLAFQGFSKIEIVNRAGRVLSAGFQEIEKAHFFTVPELNISLALFYEPEDYYLIRTEREEKGTGRILVLNSETKEEETEDDRQEIEKEGEAGEQAAYEIIRETVTGDDGEEEEEWQMEEAPLSQYVAIAKMIKDYYDSRQIKRWVVRQQLLEKVLMAYEFEEQDKEEDEQLAGEEVKNIIVELMEDDLITETAGNILLTALDEAVD